VWWFGDAAAPVVRRSDWNAPLSHERRSGVERPRAAWSRGVRVMRHAVPHVVRRRGAQHVAPLRVAHDGLQRGHVLRYCLDDAARRQPVG
jgi:hypothetical protein